MVFSMIMARGRRQDRSTGTLPAISEDGNAFSFPVPPGNSKSRDQLAEQLVGRHLDWGTARRPVPPSYMSDSDSNPSAEKAVDTPPVTKAGFLGKKLATRGGWKRLALIAVIAVVCIVGLVVGLVVGLRNRNSNSNGSSGATNPPPSGPTLDTNFPAVLYRFDTILSSSTTNCTSNSLTWGCYQGFPYTTVDWAIQPTHPGSTSYQISSTNNPFSFIFQNQTLTIHDANTETERYTFQIAMNKGVVPSTSLTSSNVATTCYFNTTTVEASIYTRIARQIGANGTTNPVSWPYAVSIQQESSSIPQCFDTQGNQVGSFTPQTLGGECTCLYQNYNS